MPTRCRRRRSYSVWWDISAFQKSPLSRANKISWCPAATPSAIPIRFFTMSCSPARILITLLFHAVPGVVYRREALADVGGFSTWNLVEDVHTSMLLHQRGWKSVYYNHPLTIGTAPTDIWSVYRQRAQWATDSLRLNFWDSPFFRRGLTFKQKMQYFNLGFVYLVSAFVMPIYFVVPVWTIFTGSFVLTASVDNYIMHRLPAFICMSVAYGILNYPTPYLQAYQMWTGLFPVFIKSTFQALRYRRRKPPYRVTSKEHLISCGVQRFWPLSPNC